MPKRSMSKLSAVLSLASDLRSIKRTTNTQCARIKRCAAILGIEGDELLSLFQSFDVARYDTGAPYNSDIKRIW